ncbi:metallophosphoesterase family protein [Mycetocola sp. JXN-3]|uniref:metallophosphoesterase family protein n=1 Tax=Mycetocola sp. JXN-3 TaxID=2116510 RepID=UPI00165D0848|nr:metallophosphoesterase [Mycetocola sp. JXN-3]
MKSHPLGAHAVGSSQVGSESFAHRSISGRGIRRTAAAAVLCVFLSGVGVAPAFAANPLGQDFEGAVNAQTAPAGWSVDNVNTAGMKLGWEGWSFHTVPEVTTAFPGSGRQGEFTRASGKVAVVQSDTNRPTADRFTSTLWSEPMALTEKTGAASVSFDSHYRQGVQPQNARLVARFDGGPEVLVENFAGDRFNQAVTASVDTPATASTVEFGWSYRQSQDNWYWMIDNVSMRESAPADVRPSVRGTEKPVVAPGSSAVITLAGLRPGQQVSAVLGTGAPLSGIPAVGADGTTTIRVAIPAGTANGVQLLRLGGPGIIETTIPVTVYSSTGAAMATTEKKVWFDGFETPESWTIPADSGWNISTLDNIVSQWGTDRRQAFTLADGKLAVIDAARGAVAGTLTSAAVPVRAGDTLEARVDSHFRARGTAGQSGTVVAVYSTGERETLRTLTSTEEAAGLRLPLHIPAGATDVRLEFAFLGAAGTGSWMVDNAQIVRGLGDLPAEAESSARVDIFSDVQGATSRLQNQVLPGFRNLGERADTVVANGDLVPHGYAERYTEYYNAYNAGGGNRYPNQFATIGNHEYFGTGNIDDFRNRFLDTTGMRAKGGQGGLWGEQLVDGKLPMLWLGSEYYDDSKSRGSGPFVRMSDTQYEWLRDRLAYWKSQNKPVLLMAHHVFANSVSGTYINFYRNDYDHDTARVAALLQDNPNVTVLTSHTHWAGTLNDWSGEKRFDPTRAQAPTIVNTVAVTTQYGPSGDWEETGNSNADPVGLRVALYEDRLRVSAFSFDAQAVPNEIKHIDIAIPGDEPTGPADPGPTDPTPDPTTGPTDPTDGPTDPTTGPTDPTGAPTAAPTTSPSTGTPGDTASGALPGTGASTNGLPLFAAGLGLIGLLLFGLRRRRGTSEA